MGHSNGFLKKLSKIPVGPETVAMGQFVHISKLVQQRLLYYSILWVYTPNPTVTTSLFLIWTNNMIALKAVGLVELNLADYLYAGLECRQHCHLFRVQKKDLKIDLANYLLGSFPISYLDQSLAYTHAQAMISQNHPRHLWWVHLQNECKLHMHAWFEKVSQEKSQGGAKLQLSVKLFLKTFLNLYLGKCTCSQKIQKLAFLITKKTRYI